MCSAHGAGAPPGSVAGAVSAYHGEAGAEAVNSPESSGRSPSTTGIVHCPECPAGPAASVCPGSPPGPAAVLWSDATGCSVWGPGCSAWGPAGSVRCSAWPPGCSAGPVWCSVGGTASVKFHWAVVDEVCPYPGEVSWYACG